MMEVGCREINKAVQPKSFSRKCGSDVMISLSLSLAYLHFTGGTKIASLGRHTEVIQMFPCAPLNGFGELASRFLGHYICGISDTFSLSPPSTFFIAPPPLLLPYLPLLLSGF